MAQIIVILLLILKVFSLLQETWCVAKPGTSEYMLQQNINYACNHVDCSPTHDGGSCFNPTTLINHASFAMNLYFQNSGRNTTSCDFRSTGLIVVKDPSKPNLFQFFPKFNCNPDFENGQDSKSVFAFAFAGYGNCTYGYESGNSGVRGRW